jgi:hypothetical protein
MTSICPAGHGSTSDDYCDVCGIPIEVAPPTPPTPVAIVSPPPTGPSGQKCPLCDTQNEPEALFCEACGYDFTTGTMPRSAAPVASGSRLLGSDGDGSTGEVGPANDTAAAVGTPGAGADSQDSGIPQSGRAPQMPTWVVEIWVDPDWYRVQESPDTMPSPGLPVVLPLRSSSVLIGRKSRSRNINPEIDCEPDSGTSRRQAQLTTDGSRWWVEDLESANGTFVGPASGPLPTDPIPIGTKYELDADDRIYVGAWTRLVVRPATEEESAAG